MAETTNSMDGFHSYDPTKYAGIISEILLPGQSLPFQLHDPDALHDISELGLDSALVFGGTVATEEDLPNDLEHGSPVKGEVWLITADSREVVWTGEKWEDLGSGMLKHVHDVTTSGTITLSGQNSMSGSATVTGTNAESAVTGSVTVPTVSATEKYVYAAAGVPDVMTGDDKAITGFGAHKTAAAITDLNTTTVKSATATPVTIPNVTGSAPVTASHVEATAVSASKITENVQVTSSHISDNTSVTASKISKNDDVTIKSVKTNSDVTASKITSNSNVTASKVTVGSTKADVTLNGSLPTLVCTVPENTECLVITWSAGTAFSGTVDVPTVDAEDVSASLVEATDVTASKVEIENKTASKVTASDVTASKITASEVVSSKIVNTDVSASLVEATDVQASKVTLGTAIEASKVETAPITVATSAKSTANAITELGTATKADFLTSVQVGAPLVELHSADEKPGDIPVEAMKLVTDVSVGSTTAALVDGKAAAQIWTQKSGTASVSGIVTVSGTVALSGTTSEPETAN